MQKINSKKIRIFSSFIFFLVTLFTSYSLGEIFYNSIDGTDFYRYFKYIEYFRGDIDSPSREQGVFYFWIIAILVESSQNFFLPDKWEYIYSTAIQLGNFILYLIGIIGFMLLMRLKKLTGRHILNPFCFKLFTSSDRRKVDNETRNTGVCTFTLGNIVTI